MAEQGSDIWSPTAVRALKTYVGRRIYAVLSVLPVTVNNNGELVNGHDTGEMSAVGEQGESHHPPARMSKDWVIQLLFDVIFLRTVLSTTAESVEESVEGLGELAQTLDARAGLTEQTRERLRKASQDYWKRTYLLFSFLA
jgi:conserved oligomeric Golgi complex subunit 1